MTSKKRPIQTKYLTVLLITLALSGLMFADGVSNFMIGIFGYAVFPYIVASILSCVLLLRGRNCNKSKGRNALLVMLFFGVVATFHVLFSKNLTSGNWLNYIITSYSVKTAGGMVFSLITSALTYTVGYRISLFIFFVFASLIGLLCIIPLFRERVGDFVEKARTSKQKTVGEVMKNDENVFAYGNDFSYDIRDGKIMLNSFNANTLKQQEFLDLTPLQDDDTLNGFNLSKGIVKNSYTPIELDFPAVSTLKLRDDPTLPNFDKLKIEVDEDFGNSYIAKAEKLSNNSFSDERIKKESRYNNNSLENNVIQPQTNKSYTYVEESSKSQSTSNNLPNNATQPQTNKSYTYVEESSKSQSTSNNLPNNATQPQTNKSYTYVEESSKAQSTSNNLPNNIIQPQTNKSYTYVEEGSERQNNTYNTPNNVVKVPEIRSFRQPRKPYVYPPIEFLNDYPCPNIDDVEDYEGVKEILESVMAEFGIDGKVVRAYRGPAFTLYEVVVGSSQSIQKLNAASLAPSIQMRMQLEQTINILTPIPGKNAVGFEIPNKTTDKVGLKNVISSPTFSLFKGNIALVLGKQLTGKIHVADLSECPHLLVAGSSGNGKSVFLNSFLISLMYRHSPDDVRILLIDAKKVEFSPFEGVPHNLTKNVIVEDGQIMNALDWLVEEMEDRYDLFSEITLRNIDEYNNYQARNKGLKMYRIVVVIDELNDVMMRTNSKATDPIIRLAQKARACGIHLILATQRPTVDVITGNIKTNIPARVAFAVTNYVDSKTIIERSGAENLIAKGDMLYSLGIKLTRLQAPYISIEEIKEIISHVKENNDAIFDEVIENAIFNTKVDNDADDMENFNKADKQTDQQVMKQVMYHFILEQKASISSAQNDNQIGYLKAKRIFKKLQMKGYVSPPINNRPGNVNMTLEQFEDIFGKINDSNGA